MSYELTDKRQILNKDKDRDKKRQVQRHQGTETTVIS